MDFDQTWYILPGDIDLWPWKSIGFQTHLRTKYVPSLVKIHWRILILECSQGWYAVNIWPGDLALWPWKSIGFQTLLRTKYVPSLVTIHWRMLILECSQGCYAVKIWPLDLWPWKSIGFQTLLRTMYVPSLVMDFDQTWYILSPYESLEPIDFQGHRSKVNVTGSNFYRVTSLWTL
jgi:hypothetical protein